VISVIDYGVGNVASIVSAYRKLNIPVETASYPGDLKNNRHVVLPGVGAFDNAMEKLKERGFIEPLSKLVLGKEINILGICVGLQMMGFQSEESPGTKGLGWLNANSRILKSQNLSRDIQLPHMGWNIALQKKDCPLLRNLESKEFYFLHSYAFESDNSDLVSSESFYGNNFISTVSSQNIFGTQFHPEKSHKQGLEILRNFVETDLC